MINIIFIILLAISMVSGLVPFIYSIKYYKAFSIQLKALFVYLTFSLLTELIIFVLTRLALSEYLATIQLCFSITEFLVIAYLYWSEFNKRSLRITVVVCGILYLIALFAGWFFTRNLSGVVDVADAVEASVFIILSVIFFFKIMTDLEIPKLTNYPFFWLNSAFLVYFGTAFFLFLFNNAAKDFDRAIIYFLSGIHHIVNVAYNILMTVALCKARKR